MPKDGKPRGRMSAFAYFLQTSRKKQKRKHPNESFVLVDFSKECSERWNAMSGKKKQRFYAMAEEDKKRYDVEMATFMKTEAGKESRKKAKLTKDPNAPKRPLSAFFLYCKDERAKVKARMENVRVIEVNKELARRWSECTEDQKFKYEVLSAIDKARYEKEIKSYKAKAKGKSAKKEEDEVEDEDEDEDEEDEDDNDETLPWHLLSITLH